MRLPSPFFEQLSVGYKGPRGSTPPLHPKSSLISINQKGTSARGGGGDEDEEWEGKAPLAGSS
jgi:hypothetical protein